MAQISTRFAGMAAVCLILSAGMVAAEIELKNGEMITETPTFIVTYVEVDAAKSDEALSLIKTQTEASESHEGIIRFEALQRIGQDNHFVLLEAWASPEARAEHAAHADTIAYREALEPLLYAPYDERPHVGLVAADLATMPEGTAETIYVVTHADIIPPEQFAPCERQIDSSGPCGNEMLVNLASFSRSHSGNMRYDILTQNNRTNHMSVVEMWSDLEKQQAHQVHPEKKQFRNQLAGIAAEGGVNTDAQFVPNMLTGSLWDERLYKLIAN